MSFRTNHHEHQQRPSSMHTAGKGLQRLVRSLQQHGGSRLLQAGIEVLVMRPCKKRFLRLFVLSLLASALFSVSAFAACYPEKQNCVGQPCASIGQTTMDFNKQTLIACMCAGSCLSGNLKWKAMGIGNKTCPSNQVLTGLTDDGQWTCSPSANPAVSCPSGIKGFNSSGQALCAP